METSKNTSIGQTRQQVTQNNYSQQNHYQSPSDGSWHKDVHYLSHEKRRDNVKVYSKPRMYTMTAKNAAEQQQYYHHQHYSARGSLTANQEYQDHSPMNTARGDQGAHGHQQQRTTSGTQRFEHRVKQFESEHPGCANFSKVSSLIVDFAMLTLCSMVLWSFDSQLSSQSLCNVADKDVNRTSSSLYQLHLVCIMLIIYHSLDLIHNLGELCSKQQSQKNSIEENQESSSSSGWKVLDLCLSLNSIFGFAVFIWAQVIPLTINLPECFATASYSKLFFSWLVAEVSWFYFMLFQSLIYICIIASCTKSHHENDNMQQYDIELRGGNQYDNLEGRQKYYNYSVMSASVDENQYRLKQKLLEQNQQQYQFSNQDMANQQNQYQNYYLRDY